MKCPSSVSRSQFHQPPKDRRMGVCRVARLDGQRPVIIQGWDDKWQGYLGGAQMQSLVRSSAAPGPAKRLMQRRAGDGG